MCIRDRDSTDTAAVASRNATAFNYSNAARLDTVPSSNDTIPQKDSTDTAAAASRNATAFNYSNVARLDTVPSSNDTIPKKDSTDSVKNATANLIKKVNSLSGSSNNHVAILIKMEALNSKYPVLKNS